MAKLTAKFFVRIASVLKTETTNEEIDTQEGIRELKHLLPLDFMTRNDRAQIVKICDDLSMQVDADRNPTKAELFEKFARNAAVFFKQQNERFQKERFLTAAGFPTWGGR